MLRLWMLTYLLLYLLVIGYTCASNQLNQLDTVDCTEDVDVCSKGTEHGINYIQSQRQPSLRQPAETLSVTVTQLVLVTEILETSSAHTKHERSDEPNILPEGGAPTQGAVRWRWLLLIAEPVYFVYSASWSLFTYFFYPAWTALFWTARVLLYLPAKFIYLLFLERPFNAVISIFLWILPVVSFTIIITMVGIIIGGSFGWLSAWLSSAIWSAPDHPDQTEQQQQQQIRYKD